MYVFFFFFLDYVCLEYTTIAHSMLNISILAINIITLIVVSQNSSSNLFLGLEPHVRALA
jgi:hypothetical protein